MSLTHLKICCTIFFYILSWSLLALTMKTHIVGDVLTSIWSTFCYSDPPFNVKVKSKSSVKENDPVELNCTSDSNPPAHSFQWFSSTGPLLEKRSTYRSNHVTRYTKAISCTATNTEGETSSAPHKFNVLCEYRVLCIEGLSSYTVVLLLLSVYLS